jgi:hypothetical protein
MTSNRKAKKMSAMEAHRAINRQFYRRMEVLDYPDVIHVKQDPYRSDVVCFKNFGSAYMDVVPHPATAEDDYQTTQYIRPRLLVKAWKERIYDAIDRLKADMELQYAGFGHEFDHCSASKVVEGLYMAVGNMECMLQELEETGRIRPYDREREDRESRERIAVMQKSKGEPQ